MYIRLFKIFSLPPYIENFFAEVGKYGRLLWWSILSLKDFSTYFETTIKRMKFIGIRSIPIVFLTAAFMGMVEAVQVLYSLIFRLLSDKHCVFYQTSDLQFRLILFDFWEEKSAQSE